MKKRLFLACALALGLSACSQHQERPVESGAPVKDLLSPVTAPGKKPDRPAVKVAPKSVQVPSVSPSYNNTPLSPRIPGVTVSRVAVPDKVVALTFHDGPHGTLTPGCWTSCGTTMSREPSSCRGNVKAHPQVVRRMVSEGHEVGNHTWNHAYLSKVSAKRRNPSSRAPMKPSATPAALFPWSCAPRRLHERRRSFLGPPALRLHHHHVGRGHE
ncbi:MAG: polysaccharide deacetylase family protein [Akkermansia sp.]